MAGLLPPDSSLMTGAQTLMQQHGWHGLYRGNLINVMRSAPQKAMDFFVFDLFKRLLGAEHSTHKTFMAAGLAGATSWLALYPLEVIRSRLTVDATRQYRGIVHCVHNTLVTEGVGSFYRGLGPSLAAIFPEAAITYGWVTAG